ncbi:MAG: protoporphyrinogen oxidase [Halobacteriaceae archaeon]
MTIGIVGAGITGLTLTHRLIEDHGEDVITFEGRSRPGGVIHSRKEKDVLLEYGPQRMRKTPAVENLIAEVQLEEVVLEADNSLPLYIYENGKLRQVPFTVREFLSTSLLSWSSKLRILMEPVMSSAKPGETVATYFKRKFGQEAYTNLLGPLFGGIYASDPAEMPVQYALSSLLELEKQEQSLLKLALKRMYGDQQAPPISFTDGLQQLPNRLYDLHESHVYLNTPVSTISNHQEKYTVHTAMGEFTVDKLVLTTPADIAANILSDIDPESASALSKLAYNPLALVHLRASYDKDGFGYQVSLNEDLRTLGVTWNCSLFDRDNLYTAFLGGMHDHRILEETDSVLMDTAADDFETVVEVPTEPLNIVRLERGFPAYDHSWQALEDVALPESIHLATNYTGRMGIPSRIKEANRLAKQLAED